MAERDWVRPETPMEAVPGARPGRSSHFELRPLSLGEVLDRTFTLYRSRFWLFAGISMIAAAVQAAGQGVALATAHRLVQHGDAVQPATSVPAALASLREIGTAQAGTYLVLLVFFLVSAVTQAGTALAVSEVYLNRSASVQGVMNRILPRWYRWIGIALWQAWSLVWIPVVAMIPALLLIALAAKSNSPVLAGIGGFVFFLAILAGFPGGFVLYLRNSLAIPAAVSEGLLIRPAMRRSKALTKGAKGRIFVVLLAAVVLLEVVAVLQMPATMLIVLSPNQQHYLARAIAMMITFVGHTVVAPVALIGLTLMYMDQRVRKEAFDLEILLHSARTPASGEPASGEAGIPEHYVPPA